MIQFSCAVFPLVLVPPDQRFLCLLVHLQHLTRQQRCRQNGYRNRLFYGFPFFVRTITAREIVPFLMVPVGVACFTVTTISSPIRAYRLRVPPKTRIHKTSLAPELSATFSLLSCCIITVYLYSLIYKNHSARSRISPILHRFLLLKGRVSIILTRSPTRHSLFSS